jgi:hypothetical protein
MVIYILSLSLVASTIVIEPLLQGSPEFKLGEPRCFSILCRSSASSFYRCFSRLCIPGDTVRNPKTGIKGREMVNSSEVVIRILCRGREDASAGRRRGEKMDG